MSDLQPPMQAKVAAWEVAHNFQRVIMLRVKEWVWHIEDETHMEYSSTPIENLKD